MALGLAPRSVALGLVPRRSSEGFLVAALCLAPSLEVLQALPPLLPFLPALRGTAAVDVPVGHGFCAHRLSALRT